MGLPTPSVVQPVSYSPKATCHEPANVMERPRIAHCSMSVPRARHIAVDSRMERNDTCETPPPRTHAITQTNTNKQNERGLPLPRRRRTEHHREPSSLRVHRHGSIAMGLEGHRSRSSAPNAKFHHAPGRAVLPDVHRLADGTPSISWHPFALQSRRRHFRNPPPLAAHHLGHHSDGLGIGTGVRTDALPAPHSDDPTARLPSTRRAPTRTDGSKQQQKRKRHPPHWHARVFTITYPARLDRVAFSLQVCRNFLCH